MKRSDSKLLSYILPLQVLVLSLKPELKVLFTHTLKVCLTTVRNLVKGMQNFIYSSVV